MTERETAEQPKNWHVLVCGLNLAADQYKLGPNLIIQRLVSPLSVFDLAAVGAVGFREWAVLEPLTTAATAELISPAHSTLPGYDGLNRCWLASTLLVLRGFARHICPAVSGYSWNFIAGHQVQTSKTFRKQLAKEGVAKAVFEPRGSLPPFRGGLLDFHLKLLIPRETRAGALDESEAKWCLDNFERFNQIATEDERFRFAL